MPRGLFGEIAWLLKIFAVDSLKRIVVGELYYKGVVSFSRA